MEKMISPKNSISDSTINDQSKSEGEHSISIAKMKGENDNSEIISKIKGEIGVDLLNRQVNSEYFGTSWKELYNVYCVLKYMLSPLIQMEIAHDNQNTLKAVIFLKLAAICEELAKISKQHNDQSMNNEYQGESEFFKDQASKEITNLSRSKDVNALLSRMSNNLNLLLCKVSNSKNLFNYADRILDLMGRYQTLSIFHSSAKNPSNKETKARSAK
jgi:hypothetical protein